MERYEEGEQNCKGPSVWPSKDAQAAYGKGWAAAGVSGLWALKTTFFLSVLLCVYYSVLKCGLFSQSSSKLFLNVKNSFNHWLNGGIDVL